MIGARIRILRAEAGMKQKDLAALLEIDPATLSLIESGRINPSVELLKKLVHEFDTSYDWLIEGQVNSKRHRPKRKDPYRQLSLLLKTSIEAIMEAEHLDKAGFAKRTKSTPERVEELLNGDDIPGGDEVFNILNGFPGYNANWILRQEGAPKILHGQQAIEELIRAKDQIVALMERSMPARKGR